MNHDLNTASQKFERPQPNQGLDELVWFVRLRLLALLVVVLATALAINGVLRDVSAPLLALVSLILGLSNLVLYYRRTSHHARTVVGGSLLLDVGLLTVLLYASGGVSNPFSFLYVIHVGLAAILLGESWTWFVAALSAVSFRLLFYLPSDGASMIHAHSHGASPLSLHLEGMWFAFTVVAATLAFFFTRMLRSLRAKDHAVQKLEAKALRAERFAAVTALAANAAHELNTPLSTIRLAAEELVARDVATAAGKENLMPDVLLILEEVNRCRDIIDRMRHDTGHHEGEMPEEIALVDLIAEVKTRLEPRDAPRVQLRGESENLALFAPRQALGAALQALLTNALEASTEEGIVSIVATRDKVWQSIEIGNQGAPIAPDVLIAMGEPFFTTKKNGRSLGLGLYLAKAFAEKLGGGIEVESSPDLGTRVRLTLRTDSWSDSIARAVWP